MALKSKNKAIERLQKKYQKQQKLELVIQSIRPFLTEEGHAFVAMQLQSGARRKHAMYNDNSKSFAMSLYFKSPSCYRWDK